jgi:hypothetical protein
VGEGIVVRGRTLRAGVSEGKAERGAVESRARRGRGVARGLLNIVAARGRYEGGWEGGEVGGWMEGWMMEVAVVQGWPIVGDFLAVT